MGVTAGYRLLITEGTTRYYSSTKVLSELFPELTAIRREQLFNENFE